MKKITINIIIFLFLPLMVKAQYLGGNGGGTSLYEMGEQPMPAMFTAPYVGGNGGGAVSALMNESPLPVELSSFTSIVNGRNIKLSWLTSSEQNNAGFDIERKTVNSNFARVGFMEGKGTVNTPTNYTFEDKNLQTGKYEYRLKQTDNNGNFEYYILASEVNIGIPPKFNLSQNYPNPFNPVTKIDYDLPLDIYVSLKVYDITGRDIKTIISENQKAGYYTIDFNASNFSSGIYFYHLQAGEYLETKKMLLIK
jgi:hypothetical protein